jgi:hypothetical protein
MEHFNKVLTSGPADPISSKVSRSKNLTVLSAEPAVCTTMKRVGEKRLLHPFSSFHNAKDRSIRGRLVRSNLLQAGNKCSLPLSLKQNSNTFESVITCGKKKFMGMEVKTLHLTIMVFEVMHQLASC